MAIGFGGLHLLVSSLRFGLSSCVVLVLLSLSAVGIGHRVGQSVVNSPCYVDSSSAYSVVSVVLLFVGLLLLVRVVVVVVSALSLVVALRRHRKWQCGGVVVVVLQRSRW